MPRRRDDANKGTERRRPGKTSKGEDGPNVPALRILSRPERRGC
jgi:hypothetical protein